MMRIQRFGIGFIVSIFSIITLVSPLSVSAATLNGHTVVLDGSGKIVPWTTDPNQGYDQVMNLAWNYLLNNVPNDPDTGKPAYFSQSYLNPDTQQVANWPHNPAGLYGMLTESALKYYDYSGNRAVVTVAENVANQMLATGMTPSTYNWANVPYSSGDAGSLTYHGAAYGNTTGVGDGQGYLEPDKVAEMAIGWLQLYRFDGNTQYRDAAIAAADALASHVRTGTASQSPWPFRVNAQTGAVRENYTAQVITPIELFDSLSTLGLGNVSNYRSARQTAWTWMMAYPMQNNVWSNYFEDVPVQSDTNNNNQLSAMMTARYLLDHPEYDANWQTHVRGLITWVEANFGTQDTGATTIREQNAFAYPMGSHTSRYASVNAELYEKTGDATAKEKAYRSLNWATYMTRSNGVVIDGPQVGNQWFTDGYADYIRHFMTSIGAVPEWAPAGQNHLLRSTSVVNAVNYVGGINYTTVDGASTEVLRTSFTPATVTVNGQALSQRSDLAQAGWTYDVATSVLKIRHDTGTNVQITSGAPGNQPPTVSLTAPTSGSSYQAPATINLAANASDSDGTVSKVDFYNGSTLLGSDGLAPYTFTWSNVPAGTYNLTAVATDSSGATTTSSASNVTVSNSPLPTPWQTSDIGSVGVAGDGTYNAGTDTFTVKGSGVDIWDAADSFRYVYQALNGDGQITARVASQQNTNPWALAGVMIRENLTAGSREAIAAITPSNGLAFTYRGTANGSSSYINGGTGTAPGWVRIKRTGSTITAYRSTDGVTWTQYAQTTIAMGTSAYVGLAVTSHNNSVLATDTFTNVGVSGSVDTTAPVISAISSGGINQNGGTISWNTDELSDSQIEYGLTTAYGSATSINTTMVTSHSQVVSGLDAATTYHYRVKSRDAAGNLAVSSDQTFTTQAPADTTPPSAPGTLSGTAVSSTQINLSWGAATDDRGVTGYRVYRNGSLLATVAATTFGDATVNPSSSYLYSVVAIDAAGNAGPASNEITVTTPAPPQDTQAPTAPTNATATTTGDTSINLTWNAATDNVGVTGYRIYRGGTAVGTTTSLNYSDTGLTAGTAYSYTIRAYDAAGNESGNSNTATATTTTPSAGVSLDKVVTTKQTTAATTISAPAFSTVQANEVLVAFIASDGPSGTQSISGVTGGGLTWTLKKRTNTRAGTSEIWQAVASSPLTNVTVTAQRASGSYTGMMSVASFIGASTTTAGATGGNNAATGAPTASLTTTKAGSWVWGVGNDWDHATARTVGANQTKVDEYLSSGGDTYWLQRQTNTTPLPGTVVTINDTAPTTDRWNLSLIEIIPQ